MYKKKLLLSVQYAGWRQDCWDIVHVKSTNYTSNEPKSPVTLCK